jgi:hypothetical protein
MKLILIYIFSGFIFLSGCASINDSLTPSVAIKKMPLMAQQSSINRLLAPLEAYRNLGIQWALLGKKKAQRLSTLPSE